jgi:hypothetical protein
LIRQRQGAPLEEAFIEHYGSAPRIKDEPPLIFHPTEKQAPGVTSGYADALERYRKSLPENVRTLLHAVARELEHEPQSLRG